MKGFHKTFHGKKVLITGHTGFKGSWLSIWLNQLGAYVYGVSNGYPSELNHFQEVKLSELLDDNNIDILNHKDVSSLVSSIKPDFIFHLAAQPIVSESFKDPIKTFDTNLMGTISILEAIRVSNISTTAIFITSDKCYENVEWPWGYKETDRLGGADPYSASKACAEIAISSYFRSYFANNLNIKIGIGRAGNVIGGGDWAENRVVPDCIRSWSNNSHALIRNPKATRPWQHVLEPLSGYLYLAKLLTTDSKLNGEAFNFGPSLESNHSVEKLVKELSKYWPNSTVGEFAKQKASYKESNLLKLNCDKALYFLNWRPTLDFDDTVKYTAEWYYNFYSNQSDSIYNLTTSQIDSFVIKAQSKGLDWSL